MFNEKSDLKKLKGALSSSTFRCWAEYKIPEHVEVREFVDELGNKNLNHLPENRTLPVRTEFMRAVPVKNTNETGMFPQADSDENNVFPVRKLEELMKLDFPVEIWMRLPDPNADYDEDEEEEDK